MRFKDRIIWKDWLIGLLFGVIIGLLIARPGLSAAIPQTQPTIKIRPSKQQPITQTALAEQTGADSIYVAVAAASVPSASNNASAYSGSHEDLMSAAGIAASDYSYVDYIVSHESGWRVDAYNPSGAYGLCQSLPASKMASAGGDYMTNPVTQLIWCNSYAQGAHGGGWYNNYLFWLANAWW